ncbi:phage terminase large subunit [Luteibacter sp.]|uniref:phage terminase large subunit n=1 Tax=Luteibacter sp. TaxID=1886636 RepID=UPI0028085311|nr:phage terminase large subunit [Luteibacter sp.]MDQ8051071.1 phage terminase large subunit [Luteibacter sp.]
MSAAADLARALDPVAVFRQGVLGPNGQPAEADEWQETVMRSGAPRQLILCNRQAGKSTTVGAKAVAGMLYDPGLYLIVAPTLRQSKLLFDKVAGVYKRLPDVSRIETSNKTELFLENGSQLVALPGDDDATIRGYSGPKAIYIDEASRVSDEVYAALRPMLATSGGQLIALTTPYGRRGWFYEAWEFQKDWTRTTITARDCPRITTEFLEEERTTMGEWRFRQEYLCEFVDTDEQFFSSDLIDAMVDNTLEAWA